MDTTTSFFKEHPMQKLFEMEYWVAILYALASVLASFISPVAPFVFVSTLFVVCDFFTGVRAAKKRGQALTSRGYLRSVEKSVLYMTALVLAEVVKVTFMPPVPITYAMALLIVRVEFKSNIENIEAVTGIKIWSALVEKFPSFLREKEK